MKKQLILGLTAGLAALTAGSVLGISKNLINLDRAKAESTIATCYMDGTHNVLAVSDLCSSSITGTVTTQVTSSTGGYVTLTSAFYTTGCYNAATGGDNGVVTFIRKGEGRRPVMNFGAEGMTNLTMNFSMPVHVETFVYHHSASGNQTLNTVQRADAASQVINYDFTNDSRFDYGSVFACEVYIWVTEENGGEEVSVTINSISCSYDVASCLAA